MEIDRSAHLALDEEGSARAREEARKTLHEVRSAMHLNYFGL